VFPKEFVRRLCITCVLQFLSCTYRGCKLNVITASKKCSSSVY